MYWLISQSNFELVYHCMELVFHIVPFEQCSVESLATEVFWGLKKKKLLW